MIKVKKDLTGMVFGRLTVIKQAEDKIYSNGSKDSQWLCKCSCGSKPFLVSGGSLKSGNTKSCGCISFTDLTGKTFGKLVVLRRAKKIFLQGRIGNVNARVETSVIQYVQQQI